MAPRAWGDALLDTVDIGRPSTRCSRSTSRSPSRRNTRLQDGGTIASCEASIMQQPALSEGRVSDDDYLTVNTTVSATSG